jgi:hypothetical protein
MRERQKDCIASLTVRISVRLQWNGSFRALRFAASLGAGRQLWAEFRKTDAERVRMEMKIAIPSKRPIAFVDDF